ncbi:MAG: divalent-cation tolerance protein CutA [Planctomycetes bacterium]|nr:divalent-cation tolerance protein CutA [Planctomycetota bacterium]
MPEAEAPRARVVLVTAGGIDAARVIARALVEERLAACVNILPGVTSIYRWEGKIAEDEEVLLLIKTTADRLDALAARVVDLHTYQVPEIVALPVAGGLAPYLGWLAEAVVPLPPALHPSEPEPEG